MMRQNISLIRCVGEFLVRFYKLIPYTSWTQKIIKCSYLYSGTNFGAQNGRAIKNGQDGRLLFGVFRTGDYFLVFFRTGDNFFDCKKRFI